MMIWSIHDLYSNVWWYEVIMAYTVWWYKVFIMSYTIWLYKVFMTYTVW